mgnify:CR=1 FL=1
MPQTKAPSTLCTPITCVSSAITEHQHEDDRDHGHLADEMVVRPSGSAANTARRPIVKLTIEEEGSPEHALRQRGEIDRAVAGQAEGDGDDDPADRVVDDRRRDQHLTERRGA